MASQLSKKAALPLAKIIATRRNNVSNTGPWATYLAPLGFQSEWFLLGLVANWGPLFYIRNTRLHLWQTHSGRKHSATQHAHRLLTIPTFPLVYSTTEFLGSPLYICNGRQHHQYTRLSKNTMRQQLLGSSYPLLIISVRLSILALYLMCSANWVIRLTRCFPG